MYSCSEGNIKGVWPWSGVAYKLVSDVSHEGKRNYKNMKYVV